MKLNTLSKIFYPLALIFAMSANATIIDFTIDVSEYMFDPVGMTWDGNHLWVVDDENDFEVHQIDPVTGELLSSFLVNPGNVDIPDTEGITWDGSHLWVMESTGVLGKYTTEGELIDTINLPFESLDGVTWNDGYFWFTNESNGEVFQIDDSGEGVGGFLTGLTEIESIDYYNGSLWVGDDNTDNIYQYDAETFELLEVIDLDALLTAAGIDVTFNDPKGITWDDDGNLWFSDDGDEVLVRIDYDAVRVPEPATLTLFSLMLILVNRKKLSTKLFADQRLKSNV